VTIAATRSGKVEGAEHDGVVVFKGIPYAAPPVGPRRWLPPAREEQWDGVRDATRFSPICAQGAFAMAALMGAPEPVKSEDALYLNVFTPACDDARRPVMVWLHGGAFLFGSGDTPWYDGSAFCRHGDVVVVTLNYRLGGFGFLHLADLFGDELEGSANAGLLDQVAALEWVRDCIGAFGGDPGDVTVFGESAGAGCVGALLGMPAARGLFRRAVLQSGAPSWWVGRERATAIATDVLDRLGTRDLDALRALPWTAIVDAVTRLGGSVTRNALPFQPVVDGATLPRPPLETVAAGAAAGVRLLVGTNRHEMTLFNLLDADLAAIDDAGIAARLARWYPEHAAEVVADYRSRRRDAPAPDLWTDLASDVLFRMPAIRLAEAQLPHAPVWMYLFTWETPAFGGMLRSTHALDIPFVFDTLDRGGAEAFTGTGADRRPVADAMHRAWIAFARTGDPSHAGVPAWPPYEPDRRATMRFDAECELLHDPLGDDRRAWDGRLG
jgi:para-nitrobenzyl esterase